MLLTLQAEKKKHLQADRERQINAPRYKTGEEKVEECESADGPGGPHERVPDALRPRGDPGVDSKYYKLSKLIFFFISIYR